ncbi:MAG: universal stress protein [Synechococcus sp.]
MFQKILVALDRSDIADRVLDEAIDLAKATGSHLMLVHVLSDTEDGAPQAANVGVGMEYWYSNLDLLSSYRDSWKRYEQSCLDQLKAEANYAKAKGVEAEWSQQMGYPGRNICDLAAAWKADAIVMGRHGRRGLNELLMGSVSNYVTHHARCAVVLVGLPTEGGGEESAEEREASPVATA